MGKAVKSKFIIFVLTMTVSICGMAVNYAAPENNQQAASQKAPGAEIELKAKSAILIESNSGRIIFEKNSHEKLPPASLTKVMPMLLFMEALERGRIKYDDVVTVSEHAQSMGGSQVYLAPGEQITVRDLMKAVVINSANDATVALAEHVSGSEETFVKMMNDKAKELGMNDTNFVNASGLDHENHYTSAYDVGLMSRELMNKYPGITEFTTIWMDTLRGGTFGLANTNKLIRYYKGANGIKTGSTSKALYCIAASAKRNNLQLISVIMAAPDSKTRFSEASKLLNYGFANYQTLMVKRKGESEGEVDVVKGLKSKVSAVYPENVDILVSKGEEKNVKSEVKLYDKVAAPIKEGQKVGEVIFKLGELEISKADIVAGETVPKASMPKLFSKMLINWWKMNRM